MVKKKKKKSESKCFSIPLLKVFFRGGCVFGAEGDWVRGRGGDVCMLGRVSDEGMGAVGGLVGHWDMVL